MEQSSYFTVHYWLYSVRYSSINHNWCFSAPEIEFTSRMAIFILFWNITVMDMCWCHLAGSLVILLFCVFNHWDHLDNFSNLKMKKVTSVDALPSKIQNKTINNRNIVSGLVHVSGLRVNISCRWTWWTLKWFPKLSAPRTWNNIDYSVTLSMQFGSRLERFSVTSPTVSPAKQGGTKWYNTEPRQHYIWKYLWRNWDGVLLHSS